MWSMTAVLITEKDKCGGCLHSGSEAENRVRGQSSDLRLETTLAVHHHMQPKLHQHKYFSYKKIALRADRATVHY